MSTNLELKVPRASQAALAPRQRYLFTGINGSQYRQLLAIFGDQRFHHSFQQGRLEIMSPSFTHEYYKDFLARLVLVLTEELGLEVLPAGSFTLTSSLSEEGLEPDACFFIAQETKMRGKTGWRAEQDPPPDLAVEIDIRIATVLRQSIYAKLRVPELWLFNGEQLVFLGLNASGEYVELSHSLSFPRLQPQDLLPWLDTLDEQGQNEIVRAFRKWIPTHLQ